MIKIQIDNDIDNDSFIVHVKTNYSYKDIAGNV